MKKKMALLLTVTMLVTLLGACGDKQVTENPGDNPVTVEPSVSIDDVTTSVETPVETPAEDPYPEFVPDENVKPDGDTAAVILCNRFMIEAALSEDMFEIANAIVSDETIMPLALEVMECTPGYLNGFSEEIKGFDTGVMMIPMIGSQPFASYILKTNDPASLISELEACVDLRWNICTEADEMQIVATDTLVYVVLAPWTFDN